MTGSCLDRRPGRDRRHRLAHLAPGPHQAAPDQRVLHAIGGIEIPAVGSAARTAARLVVGQAGAGARIVGLLRLPGDDAGLDVDLPRTGPGAVHPVGRADDLVVPPAVSVGVLPVAVLAGGLAPTVGELFQLLALEEVQSVEQMAHRAVLSGVCVPGGGRAAREFGRVIPRAGRRRPCGAAPVFDVVQQAAGARVDGPGDHDAEHVEDQEGPERAHGGPGHRDGRAVGLGDEEGAVGCDGRGEGHDRAGLHRDLPLALLDAQMRHQARHLAAHDHGDHLEGGGVADPGQEEQRHEAGEETDERAEPEEGDHAERGRDHRDEGPEASPARRRSGR